MKEIEISQVVEFLVGHMKMSMGPINRLISIFSSGESSRYLVWVESTQLWASATWINLRPKLLVSIYL